MKEDAVSERLRMYLVTKSWSAKDFERATRLGNGTAAKIGNATRQTTFDRISNSGIDLNVSWLKTGEGEMLKPNGIDSEILDDRKKDFSDYGLVPLVNIDSVGGIHSDNAIATDEQYVMKLIPFSEARPDDRAIFQSGNSMYPIIPSGSVLLIREVIDWREYFGYGSIYVLWLRDGRRITKEVRRYDPDPKNYVMCVSFNPDVADEELPRSMIRGVWKVVKYVADFGW